MIKTPNQLQVSLTRAQQFRDALTAADRAQQAGAADALHPDEIASMRAVLEDIEDEIRVYERLAAGDRSAVQWSSLADLPKAIIQHRIVRGWSQSEFARQLNVPVQQVQRWEVRDNETVAFATLTQMCELLGIEVEPKKHVVTTTMNEAGALLFRRTNIVRIIDPDTVLRGALLKAPDHDLDVGGPLRPLSRLASSNPLAQVRVFYNA